MGDYVYEVVHTEPDIPVRCFSYLSGAMQTVPAHWHDEVEVIRLDRGKMTVLIGTGPIVLSAGDWIPINSRDIHTTISEAGSVIEVIQIPFPLLKKYIPEADGLRLIRELLNGGRRADRSEAEEAGVGAVIHRLALLAEERPDGFVLDFHSDFFRLLSMFYRSYMIPAGEAGQDQKGEDRRRLILVMDYVNRNYRERITLDEAAGLVSLNKEYFCRLFKRHMGMTFLEYVNEIRFYHVCEDLFSSETGVMTLLEEHGFTNYKRFMKLFHERYQGTPAKIRRQMQK